MQLNNKTKQLKPYHGITVFALVILAMIFIAAPIQSVWGIYGVAVTELMILALGLVPAIFLKADLRDMFPVKKPMLRQITGILVMWVGSYLTVILITLITGYLFPEGLTQVNNGIQSVTTSVPMGIAFIIIAVMPAVCEEALHRGFILSSMYSLKNKWYIILCMGIIFGIFHLDPYRFLPTAVLGMMMTYIMIETKNILMPALFHLFNNALTTFVSFTGKTQAAASGATLAVPLNAIAAYLIIGAAVPFILLLGARLIHKKGQTEEGNISTVKKGRRKTVMAAVICSVVMAATGIVTMGFSIKGAAPVFETSVTSNVNYDSKDLEFPMKVEKSGSYTMDLELASTRGLVAMKIIDGNGKEVYNTSCMQMTSNGPLKLEEGLYKVIVEFHIDDMEQYCTQVGIAYDEKAKEQFKMTGNLYDYTPFKMKMIVK
jgi:Predicted metal-dependent membrane protease